MVTYILFEESGKLSTGHIVTQNESSFQVDTLSGKRIKVKSSQALLTFHAPAPELLLAQAQTIAQTIDLDLIWQCASEDEFDFQSLSCDYFGPQAQTLEHAATLICLHEAPHYFRRLGKGHFRKASAQVVEQALLAIHKKKAIEAQIQSWIDDLLKGQCPSIIQEQRYVLLFKPDKQSPPYKALAQAAKIKQLSILHFLQSLGVIDRAFEFHWQGFVFEHFSQQPLENTAIELAHQINKTPLPIASVQAFSIDDSLTTEIDDALSLQSIDEHTVILGIHIAAPALGIQQGDPIDKIAQERMSTVYIPGYKITMLPQNVIEQFSLKEGQAQIALSLYLHIHPFTFEIKQFEFKVEKVPIVQNIRYDQYDDSLLNDPSCLNKDAPFSSELQWLRQFANHRKKWRELQRGKPENTSKADYSFKIDKKDNASFPDGDETVYITPRNRESPLDQIVSETMILANQITGQYIADRGVPAIYRSQASLAPGMKVRMGSQALPHAGLGVPCYAWSTSPLRRYTDLVNQWQLIACLYYGPTAALKAPFKQKDVLLLSIIHQFENTYQAYHQFQKQIERYWTLRYIKQHDIQEVEATIIKEGWAQVDTLPLSIEIDSPKELKKGDKIRLRLATPDFFTLEIKANFIQIIAS